MLGVAVLLVPVTLFVSVLPTWLEREAVALAIAREAARAVVLASDSTQGARAAERVAAETARNHGYDREQFALRLTGTLRRGGEITAQVRTTVPLTRLPLFGPVGRFPVVERHTEQVDPYRSW